MKHVSHGMRMNAKLRSWVEGWALWVLVGAAFGSYALGGDLLSERVATANPTGDEIERAVELAERQGEAARAAARFSGDFE